MVWYIKLKYSSPGRSRKGLPGGGSGFAEGFSLLTTEHCIHWLSDEPLVNFAIYTAFWKKSSSTEWDSCVLVTLCMCFSYPSLKCRAAPWGQLCHCWRSQRDCPVKNPSLKHRSKSTRVCIIPGYNVDENYSIQNFWRDRKGHLFSTPTL